MINDYMLNKLPVSLKGEYGSVDVRDIALTSIKALDKGRVGECYLLNNRHYEVNEIFKIIRYYKKCHKVITIPLWMVKSFVSIVEMIAKKTNKKASIYSICAIYN